MIEIQAGDHEIKQLLIDLGGRMKNMKPVMRKISSIMLDAVEENFAREGRPRWKPLAKSTIRQRTRQGTWPGKVLQRTAAGLAPSISEKYDANSARVGTSKPYGPIQHFGGTAGSGHKVHIPARPFMTLTAKDRGAIKITLMEYLFKRQ